MKGPAAVKSGTDALSPGSLHHYLTHTGCRSQRVSEEREPGEPGFGDNNAMCRRSGDYRSSARRPTSHHAKGNNPAAMASLTASPSTNGSSPLSMAIAGEKWAAAASQGTPTR